MKKYTQLLICFLSLMITTAFRSDQTPVVFLIGDSISMGYGNYLEHNLGEQMRLERKADDGASKNLDIPVGANGGDSHMVLTYLKEKVKDPTFHPDYLLLNCGLHDVKHDPKTGKIAVDSDAYQRNLKTIYQLVHAKGVKLIWITTTEIIDSLHNRKGMQFLRYGKDVEQYNHIAGALWTKQHVPQIDLYTFTKRQRSGRFKDHAHYYDDICALQGAFVAGSLEQIIRLKSK